MAALDMPRRALWPELAVFAANPWKQERRCSASPAGRHAWTPGASCPVRSTYSG
jgi:hypothetical protein